jgi:hypothetical protein
VVAGTLQLLVKGLLVDVDQLMCFLQNYMIENYPVQGLQVGSVVNNLFTQVFLTNMSTSTLVSHPEPRISFNIATLQHCNWSSVNCLASVWSEFCMISYALFVICGCSNGQTYHENKSSQLQHVVDAVYHTQTSGAGGHSSFSKLFAKLQSSLQD